MSHVQRDLTVPVQRYRDWDTVDALTKRIETAFLKAGDNLEVIAGGVSSLRDPIATLSEVQYQTWQDISGQLNELGALNQALEDALFQYSSATGSMVSASDGLFTDVDTISRTMRIMKIVAVNARVTASALTDRESGLDVFTTTTSDLIQSADDTLGEVRALISDILDRMTGPFEQNLMRGWDTLAKAQGRLAEVEGIVSTISNGQGQGGQFGAALAERLAHIERSLTTAALNMQAGDRARQRIEHASYFATRARDLGSPFVLALGQAQLSDTVSGFGLDVIAIEHLLRDAMNVGRQLARPGEDHSVIAEKSAQEMCDAVRDMQLHMSALNEVRISLNDLVDKVLRDFERLNDALERIDTLEDQMRIVGVNAIISCGRLGEEGMALKEVANQLAALAAEIALHLSGVRAKLGEVENHSDNLTGEMAERPRALIEQMEHDSVDLLRRLEDIFGKWATLRSEMGGVLDHLNDNLASDMRTLKTLAEELGGAARSLGTAPTPEAAPPVDIIHGELFELYSMDQERDLHRKFSIENGIGPPPDLNVASSSQTDDDIFF